MNIRLTSYLTAYLTGLLLLFVLTPLAATAQVTIEGVRIEGNRLVEPDTILMQVTAKAGEKFDKAKVEKDVKEIYRTGFFDQVLVKLEEHGNRGQLIFQVTEKPAIRNVSLQGNDVVDSETLKEKLNLTFRRFLDRAKIQASIEEAKKYYESQGLYDTEISFLVDEAEDNQVDLTFVVKEGEKKVIREIVFEGNNEIDADDLEEAIQTSTHNWWTSWLTGSGIVKQEQLEADTKELSRFYLNHGYLDIRVTEPTVEPVEDGLKLTYKVEEGKVYTIGQITASGTLVEDDQSKTLEGVELKSGDVFNLDQLRKDTFAVTEKFTDVGYAFANVEPESKPNKEAQTVDLNYKIEKGELVDVNRINISGNAKTHDNVIRRSLTIGEGEQFSSSKIRRSQELVQRLGYFDEVTVTPNQTGVQNQVDIDVAVREGQTGTFSVGAGVSSGEGFIFTSKVSETNLFGTGDSLSLNVDTGSQNENYVLSFNNPRVDDSRLSLGTNLLSVKREFDDFNRHQDGGSVSFGYPFPFLGEEFEEDLRFGFEYEFLKVKIDNVDVNAPTLIKNEEGTSTSSSVTPSVTYNTIDNPLDPTKGLREQLSTEVAGLGGDEEFWLLQASSTLYYPMFDTPFGPITFSQRTRLGYGETFNDDDFPLFRRFFPGGINSVRGYESRQLGPKDEQGNEYGGSKQLVLNFETIFPVFPSLRLQGVAFYDVGNAFDDNQGIEISELKQAVGFGFRWRSPIAPIRVEFGFPLDKEEGDKSMVTNFSFGSPL